MATQRYTVAAHPIETLLTWVTSGEIAIPKIQRLFVSESTKVRNLIYSLNRAHQVGSLIAWRNSTVGGETQAQTHATPQRATTALLEALPSRLESSHKVHDS